MGIRERKNTLIGLMRARANAAHMDPKQFETYELMLRRARTTVEQDHVMQVFKTRLDGWQTSKDALAVIKRGFLEDEDEDEDPPGLKAALARSQVFLRK